jgi:hypothetical protein
LDARIVITRRPHQHRGAAAEGTAVSNVPACRDAEDRMWIGWEEIEPIIEETLGRTEYSS